MKNERDIRPSIDRRLSSLAASADRRARIRQTIMQEEEPIVKKKLSISMAFALALVIAVTGLAAAAGIDLFRYFSQDGSYMSDMLAQIAPVSIPTDNPPADIGYDGNTTASGTIRNTYYDGQFLTFAYSITGSHSFTLAEPTDEQLAGAWPTAFANELDSDNYDHWRGAARSRWDELLTTVSPESRAAMESFAAAVDQGEKACLAYHRITAGERRISGTAEGSFGSESVHTQLSGEVYVLYSATYPLPKAAQDLDSIDLSVDLVLITGYLYFDGETFFNLPGEQKIVSEMTACAPRSSVAARTFEGSGTFGGAPVTGKATVTEAYGTITLYALDHVFKTPAEADMTDLFGGWRLLILDQDGNELHTARAFDLKDGYANNDANSMALTLLSNGVQPETLYVYPYYGNGDQTVQEIKALCEPIVLDPVP